MDQDGVTVRQLVGAKVTILVQNAKLLRKNRVLFVVNTDGPKAGQAVGPRAKPQRGLRIRQSNTRFATYFCIYKPFLRNY